MLSKKRNMPAIRSLFLAGMIVAAAMAGCNRHADDSSKNSAAAAASVKTVSVIQPERKSLCRIVEQPGAIQADEETLLYARVPGYVSKVLFDIGQEIKKGDVLAEIDVPELAEETNQKKALAKQAKAEVEQAQKALASAEANIAAMQATVVEAKALHERWESESKRIAKLVESGTIDAQTRDEVQHQYKAAGARVLSSEAAVRKANADRDKAAADVRAAEARVDVANAEIRRLEALLAFAKIQAPYDGIVTARKVNTGDLVQPGKGESLFTVAKLHTVRAVIDVPEADACLVQQGKSEVTLSVPALRETNLKGTVTRTSWALKSGARTLRVEIDLPNKNGRFRPGMYVYAHVRNHAPESWTLPASALAKQGDKTVCFLVKDAADGAKVVGVPVQVGLSDGQFTEVLKMQKSSTDAFLADMGKVRVALRASELSDGQAIQIEKAGI
jgi:multidrug efflux pump subunit AcrA (membrane-fusion protein)